MNVVIDTGALYRIGSDEEVLRLIKKAGYKYYDFSLFWRGTCDHLGDSHDERVKNAHELRAFSDKLGLKCEQSHSFFMAGADQKSIAKRIEYISSDIIVASILGAKSIVVHPICELSLEENIEYLKKFIPLAHKYDILLAIENVWGVENDKIVPMCSSTPESFVKLLDSLDDNHVVACLDIGHAEMNQMGTSAVEMINALGKRLYCLHIHDNDKYSDAHQMPYTNKINFNAILRTLKNNKYKGNITFEVETTYNRGEEPDANLPLELFLPYLKLELEIGNYFKKAINK